MNATIQAILDRRSVRAFQEEKQIEEEKLQAILSTANCAPTSINQQKYHFTVVQNVQLIHKIDETIKGRMKNSPIEFLRNQAAIPGYAPLHHAPTVIFITTAHDAEYPAIDCALACENMVIAAASLGIASCVTTSSFFLFNTEAGVEIRNELQIPEGNDYVIALALGYAEEDIQYPPRDRRQDCFNFVR